LLLFHGTIKNINLKRPDIIPSRIIPFAQIAQRCEQWRFLGKKIVFTNGVFDLVHQGHIYSLSQAASEGDILIVGLNSDTSVKRLKGNDRPIQDESTRALILASLAIVDGVIIFETDTPLDLINLSKPDILVKGGDYTIDEVVGAKETLARGGRVVINPTLEGFSTTATLEKIRDIHH
jgi:rfaE bifunctional protein nucleotidyltransferase chain/domain